MWRILPREHRIVPAVPVQLKLAWILRGSVLLRPVDEGVRVLSQVEEGATQSSGGDRVKIITVFVMSLSLSLSELLIKSIMILIYSSSL